MCGGSSVDCGREEFRRSNCFGGARRLSNFAGERLINEDRDRGRKRVAVGEFWKCGMYYYECGFDVSASAPVSRCVLLRYKCCAVNESNCKRYEINSYYIHSFNQYLQGVLNCSRNYLLYKICYTQIEKIM